MKTSAPTLPPADSQTATAAASWQLRLTASCEPLMLARVLQKLAVPEIELRAARYQVDVPEGGVSIELTFFALEERARLVGVRLQKIVGVRQVKLTLTTGGRDR